MESKKLAIIMLGAPGSGKGTQGELLEKATGFKKYVMSDLIKVELKAKTKEWSQTYDVESGLLLGDKEIFELFREHFKAEQEVILDGIPRTLDQAYWLYGYLMQHEYDIKVIYLKVNEDHLLERIIKRGKEQGRGDDNAETFKERLKIFDEVRDAVLSVYKGEIIEIEGEGQVEEISRNVVRSIIEK